MKRHVHDFGSSEQLGIAITDGGPTATNSADRVVHARHIAFRLICRETIEVPRVEAAIKVDQRIERAAVVSLAFDLRYLSWS